MKVPWLLLVACVAACGGKEADDGPDTAPADIPDIVDIAGETTFDAPTRLDSVDTSPAPDAVDSLDAILETDTLDVLDSVDVCIPACDGKECGPDDCGGICGTCTEPLYCLDGICLDCQEMVSISPDCAHVAHHVFFGEELPVAVFRTNAPCAVFSHVATNVDPEIPDLLQVELVGCLREGHCPPCNLQMIGIVWLPPLEEGIERVKVGDLEPEEVFSSNPADPYPSPDCETTGSVSGDWTWAYQGADPTPYQSCTHANQSVPTEFLCEPDGCHSSTLIAEGWPGSTHLYPCMGTRDLFFLEPTGAESPEPGPHWTYPGSATLCDASGLGGEPLSFILGLHHMEDEDAVTAFLFEQAIW